MPTNPLWSLLCDPRDHVALLQDGDALRNPVTGQQYSIREGCPVLLADVDVGKQNAKFQRMYDRLAWLYDLGSWAGNVVTLGKLARLRRLLASRVPLAPGVRCLYTSIGTGADVPFVAERVGLDRLEFIGLDLSAKMLRRCQRRLRRFRDTTLLVQANAEQLPFADGTFDIVVHVGGINFFDQPAVAAAEMIRVGKPGAAMLIADETQQLVRSSFEKSRLTRDTFKDAVGQFDPQAWLPPGMDDIRYEEAFGAKAYILTFRIPG